MKTTDDILNEMGFADDETITYWEELCEFHTRVQLEFIKLLKDDSIQSFQDLMDAVCLDEGMLRTDIKAFQIASKRNKKANKRGNEDEH